MIAAATMNKMPIVMVATLAPTAPAELHATMTMTPKTTRMKMAKAMTARTTKMMKKTKTRMMKTKMMSKEYVFLAFSRYPSPPPFSQLVCAACV